MVFRRAEERRSTLPAGLRHAKEWDEVLLRRGERKRDPSLYLDGREKGGIQGPRTTKAWQGRKNIEGMIAKGLKNTSVTVVCGTHGTALRPYINDEIVKSLERGNGLVAIQIHHWKDPNIQDSGVGRHATYRVLQCGVILSVVLGRVLVWCRALATEGHHSARPPNGAAAAAFLWAVPSTRAMPHSSSILLFIMR